jgi:hypothetical protein
LFWFLFTVNVRSGIGSVAAKEQAMAIAQIPVLHSEGVGAPTRWMEAIKGLGLPANLSLSNYGEDCFAFGYVDLPKSVGLVLEPERSAISCDNPSITGRHRRSHITMNISMNGG